MEVAPQYHQSLVICSCDVIPCYKNGKLLLFVLSICFSFFIAQLFDFGNRLEIVGFLATKKKRRGTCLNQAPISALFFFHFGFHFRFSILFGHALSAENRKENRRHEQQHFLRVLLVSAATSKYPIRIPVHSTQPKASTATQPHRTPVNSKQANHNNSPDVLGPLFPGMRVKLEENWR